MANTNINPDVAAALKAEFDALQAELRFAQAINDETRAKKAHDAITSFIVRNPDMMKFVATKATAKVMNKKVLTRVGIGFGVALLGIGGALFARR